MKTFLCLNNILFLFLCFKCYFCTSNAIASHTQSFCKVLLRKVVHLYYIMRSTIMAEEVKIANDSMRCFSQ